MRFRLPVAFAVAALLTSLSLRARAAEPSLEPPVRPAADHPPAGARLTHIVAGAAVTGGAYGLAVGSSYLFSDMRGAEDLRIPIAGPWMALAQTGCPTSDPDCSVVPLVLGAIFQVIDGVTQAGGLAIIGEGLFLTTSSSRSAPKKAATSTLRAVPMDFGPGPHARGRHRLGFGFVGTF